jgi:Dolichyl-phosphate-mannose-protein mannosyltransferase
VIRPGELSPVFSGGRRLDPMTDLVAWLEQRPSLVDAAAIAVVVLGGVLRFYRSTALSMWLDEGFTIAYSRMPWDRVLGLLGAYDAHPPGYYVLVKAVASFVPQPEAGRYLSVTAGMLTIGVLYGLASRLTSRPAALVALVVLALSPLAVWYSQDARPYAVTGLVVALAYLALVAFYQTPRVRWAALYAVAISAAVYLDYSAFYALAPQVLAYPIIARRHRRSAIPLLIGAIAAILSYLPWIGQLTATVQGLGSVRSDYLKVDTGPIVDSALSVVGLAGQGVYFAGSRLSPWFRWASFDDAFALVAVVAILIGCVALARRPFGLLVVGALLVGTFTVAAISSLISPGFAPRTVSYAIFGWAILLGAAVCVRGIPGPSRLVALFAVGLLLAMSAANLQATYVGGDKEHWRDLAADTEQAARFGFPIVTYPAVAPTLLSLYEPAALGRLTVPLDDVPDLSRLDVVVKDADAIWFAYYEFGESGDVGQHLLALGYERVAHRAYPYSLFLDLYVRTGVVLGEAVALDTVGGRFWTITPTTAGRVSRDNETGLSTLTLTNPGPGEASIVADVPGSAERLYALRFQARSHLGSGNMRSFLICVGQGGLLQVAPNDYGATVSPDGSWHDLIVSVLCPVGTTDIRVDLRNAGVGAIDLRAVALSELRSP